MHNPCYKQVPQPLSQCLPICPFPFPVFLRISFAHPQAWPQAVQCHLSPLLECPNEKCGCLGKWGYSENESSGPFAYCLLKVSLLKLHNDFLIAKSDYWLCYASILTMLQNLELFIIPWLVLLFPINYRVFEIYGEMQRLEAQRHWIWGKFFLNTHDI